MTTKPSRRIFDAAALKREFPGLADPQLHYLDNAATAQTPDVVLNALRRFEVEARANVHEGMHARARAATDSYNQARASVARFLHANSDQEVVFTYGTTSSINLLAHSLAIAWNPVTRSCCQCLSTTATWCRGKCLPRGVASFFAFCRRPLMARLDLEWLETELTDRCRLVALTHCSNVTGAMTDVSRMVAAARAVGAKVMLDGAQRTPHGPLDLRKLDVDFYAFSGHKTYGPMGIGVLWGRRELLGSMPPFMTGGQIIQEVTLTNTTFRPPPRRFEAGHRRSPQPLGLALHSIGCRRSTGAPFKSTNCV